MFGTSPGSHGEGRSESPFLHSQLVAAASALTAVEMSAAGRRVVTGTRVAWVSDVTSLEVRAAGVLGEVWLPLPRPADIRRDIDGCPVEGLSSDGATFAGYCVGVGIEDGGATVRFVLRPTLPPTATWLSVTLNALRPELRALPLQVTVSLDES